MYLQLCTATLCLKMCDPNDLIIINELQRGTGATELPTDPEVIRETNELYLTHLMSQIRRVGLDAPQLGSTRMENASRNTRNMRAVADIFENSPQRQWVREQAHNVDLDSLNPRTFQELLIGLFQVSMLNS